MFPQKLVFEYDDAGNQVIRKWECAHCKVLQDLNPDSTVAAAGTEHDHFIANTDVNPAASLSVYPNPVNTILEVRWMIEHHPPARMLFVYSIQGQLLLQRNILPGQRQMRINFAPLASGVYLVVVLYGDGSNKAVKVIKG